MKKPNNYRLRIILPANGTGSPTHTYITRYGERVSYLSASETPLALSNLIHDDAAALRFALEDAFDGSKAAQAVRAVLTAQWKNVPARCPKVEVLS